MKSYNFYVYILTSENNNVLYVGFTNNMERRLYEHKNMLLNGFTSKYKVHKLVHIEHYTQVSDALDREKQLKSWSRTKKIALIKMNNPNFEDLAKDWNII